MREPCCDLRYIGGDGTGIGITIGNLDNIAPVWQPPCSVRNPVKQWGRLDRCGIGHSPPLSDPKEKASTREFIHNVTKSSVTRDHFPELQEKLQEASQTLPPEIIKTLELWLTTDNKNAQWNPLRLLLRAFSREDTLCGMIPLDMIPFVETAIAIASKPRPFTSTEDKLQWNHALNSIRKQGMGPEIAETLENCREQTIKSPVSGRSTMMIVLAFLQYIGEQLFFNILVTCSLFHFSV